MDRDHRRVRRRDRDADPAFRPKPLCGRRRGKRGDHRLDPGASGGLLQRRHGDPDEAAHAKRDHVVDRVLFFGGIAHIFLTESYRHATASVVAPFDYTSMLWALLLGYWVFGELPSGLVYVGAIIVAGAGLYVIWRERQLGVERAREAEGRFARPLD